MAQHVFRQRQCAAGAGGVRRDVENAGLFRIEAVIAHGNATNAIVSHREGQAPAAPSTMAVKFGAIDEPPR
jgi:hypothetical protein